MQKKELAKCPQCRHITRMTTNEAIAAAAVLGTIAHNEGKTSTPAHDKNLINLVAENSTGMGWSIPILKAWSQSWHAANLAKTV